MNTNYTLQKVGFWSTLLAALLGFTHLLPQVLSEMKFIPPPKNLLELFLPTLLLATTFLVAMLSLHYAALKEYKIWTALGVVFSVLYCGNVFEIYFNQLSAYHFETLEKGSIENNFVYDNYTFLLRVDLLGYCFISIATFFAAFAFKNNKWLYRALLWNGIILPFLILAFFYPIFYMAAIFWIVTFPMAMIYSAMFFRYSITIPSNTIL